MSTLRTVSEHVPCDCGYDLYGLAYGASCPECGASIGQTLARRKRDQEWADRVRRKSHTVLAAGFIIVITVNVLMTVCPLGFLPWPDQTVWAFFIGWLVIAGAVFLFVGAVSAAAQRHRHNWFGAPFLLYVAAAVFFAFLNLHFSGVIIASV